jgi:hypothetical protein
MDERTNTWPRIPFNLLQREKTAKVGRKIKPNNAARERPAFR